MNLDRYFERFRNLPKADVDVAWNRVVDRASKETVSAHEFQSVSAPAQRPSRWRWAAAAAAAVGVALVALIPMTVGAPAVLEDGQGSRKVSFGEVVRGGTLKFPDGSRVQVDPQSEVSLERIDDGVRLSLRKGQVAVLSGEARVQQGTTERRIQQGEVVSTVKAPPEKFETISIRPYSNQGALQSGQRGGSGTALPSGCSGVTPQVDPSRFSVGNVTVFTLLTFAYGTTIRGNTGGCFDLAPLNLISGGPDWIKTERWDVQATIPASLGLTQEQIQAQLKSGDYPQIKKMLLAMLEDRFKLVLHKETKEIPAYILTLDKNSSRLTATGLPPGMPTTPQNVQWWEGLPSGENGGEPGGIMAKEAPFSAVVPLIAREATRPVIDRTGLTMPVTFWISFRPIYNYLTGRPVVIGETSRLAGLPTLQKALEEIGLKLEDTKVSREVWVIERIERPSEN